MPNEPDRKYVRVYYSIQDDPKFDRVRGNVAVLGTWLRLLMAADAVWPASADLPRALPGPHIRTLIEVGLVDELPEHRFRIHGLDTERNARRNAASNAASMRWQSDSNAPALREHGKGNAETMPSKAEPSKAEPSKAEPSKAEPSKAEQRLAETVVGREGGFPPIGSRSIGLVKPTGTDR